MGKISTFPTLYDEALQIRLSKLKEWGYLKEPQIKPGTITWSRNGNTTGNISIAMNTLYEPYYLELNYSYKGEPRKYKIGLQTIASNLGRGVVWYFVCPHTGKRCRVLYSISGYFYHRSAFRGCMYEVQTYSKKARQYKRAMNWAFGTPEEKELNSRYFKRYYAGKPTKRYSRILKQISKSESVTSDEIRKILFY
jgi:hypothetical protein